jgi:hypothetical protein
MVRTLSSKKNFSANCKGSEEIEPLLSGDLIDSSISNPGHSSIGIPVNNSMDYAVCNSTNNLTNNLTNNSTNNLANNSRKENSNNQELSCFDQSHH